MIQLVPITDLDTFTSTREALHQVAEHVLAKARFVDDGQIRLTTFAGGFGTPLLSDGRRVRIEGPDLVVDHNDGSRRTGLATIGEAAAFVGVDPGSLTEVYPAATALQPDRPLSVDPGSAHELAIWFGFTAEVLDLFAAELDGVELSPLVLWPEHFDQAFFTHDPVETRRSNYGASPGDEGHPEPYLYVGPFGRVAADKFWNATHFNGAVLSLSELMATGEPAETALRFLRTGRALLEKSGA